jgi:hypothetical protein
LKLKENSFVAKKKTSRRPNLSQETLERARAELRGEKMAASATIETGADGTAAVATSAKAKVARPTSSLAARHIPSAEELKVQYHFVLTEMRYVVTLAAVLFAVIIAAAIAMPYLVQ